uniref:Nebulette n=1 Tax=Canis lupus familiaris TaxID=9615 RepID=A0A8P0TTF4_CANLF
MSLGSYRLDLEASGISLPLTSSLSSLPFLPPLLHKRGKVVDPSFCSGCSLTIQVLYKENLGTGIPVSITPEMQRVKHNQENLSSVLYKENMGKGTPLPVTPEMERVKHNQENISSVLYREQVGKATPTPVTPEMQRVKRNQENISSVCYRESVRKGTPTAVTPEMERASAPGEPELGAVRRRLPQAHPGQGRARAGHPGDAARARDPAQRVHGECGGTGWGTGSPGPTHGRPRTAAPQVKYHEDFEKHKGCFTPVVTDPITERVKKNTQDVSDITYRGIRRRVVEMEPGRGGQAQEPVTGLRVWRTNPGSVFDYDPAEDNIQSRSLHLLNGRGGCGGRGRPGLAGTLGAGPLRAGRRGRGGAAGVWGPVGAAPCEALRPRGARRDQGGRRDQGARPPAGEGCADAWRPPQGNSLWPRALGEAGAGMGGAPALLPGTSRTLRGRRGVCRNPRAPDPGT